jgi:hypothetical protein
MPVPPPAQIPHHPTRNYKPGKPITTGKPRGIIVEAGVRMERSAHPGYPGVEGEHDPGARSYREGRMSASSANPPAEVYYPETDGKPMGETGIHVFTTMEVFGTLKFIIYKDHPSTTSPRT